MNYSKFAAYNVGGALVWTALFVGAGFFFGTIPAVQVSRLVPPSSSGAVPHLWLPKVASHKKPKHQTLNSTTSRSSSWPSSPCQCSPSSTRFGRSAACLPLSLPLSLPPPPLPLLACLLIQLTLSARAPGVPAYRVSELSTCSGGA
jgi:hypothetical protein